MPVSPNDALAELETVASLVGSMRDAQRAYFASRDPEALVRARELEAVVDRWLALRKQPAIPGLEPAPRARARAGAVPSATPTPGGRPPAIFDGGDADP